MRCRWTVRRTMRPDPDGRRRWDRAYQEVLTWTEGPADEPAGVSPGPGAREDGRESGALCPRVDAASGAGPDGRATGGASGGARPAARLGRAPRPDPPRCRLQRRVPAASGPRPPARSRRRPQPRPDPDHGPGSVGPQLRPSGPAAGGTAGAWLRGTVPRPSDEPGPARPAAVADPRRGRGVRAHADHRAHAPRPSAQAGGGADAALDAAALRLPGRPGPAARSRRRARRGGRGGRRARDVRLVRGGGAQLLLPRAAPRAARDPDLDRPEALEPRQHPGPADQPGLRRPGLRQPLAPPRHARAALGDGAGQALGDEPSGRAPRGVDPGGRDPAPGQPGAVRPRAGTAGQQSPLRAAQQPGPPLFAAEPGQLRALRPGLPGPNREPTALLLVHRQAARLVLAPGAEVSVAAEPGRAAGRAGLGRPVRSAGPSRAGLPGTGAGAWCGRGSSGEAVDGGVPRAREPDWRLTRTRTPMMASGE